MLNSLSGCVTSKGLIPDDLEWLQWVIAVRVDHQDAADHQVDMDVVVMVVMVMDHLVVDMVVMVVIEVVMVEDRHHHVEEDIMMKVSHQL